MLSDQAKSFIILHLEYGDKSLYSGINTSLCGNIAEDMYA